MTIAVLLLVASCAPVPSRPAAHRVIATPEPTGTASVTVTTPAPTLAPTKRPAPVAAAPKPTPVAAAPKLASVAAASSLSPFRGLGAWIDVFDHTDDPASVLPLVKGMSERGTKTLYLESARFSTKGDFEFPKAMGAALDEAKARGMKVVAWYPPDFTDVDADVKRSVAAARYVSPGGHRFDAFAADIEYTAGVPDHTTRNELAIGYSKRLRKAVGASYPLAAIVIPPTWLEINPNRWPDFPWSELAPSYEVFMPMEYWTARGKDPGTAYDLTKTDTAKTKALTGRSVHIIGGLGADADAEQTAAYVKAVKEARSIGGGLYDYTTTRSEAWAELRKLNG